MSSDTIHYNKPQKIQIFIWLIFIYKMRKNFGLVVSSPSVT
jgi:hypothetical protein